MTGRHSARRRTDLGHSETRAAGAFAGNGVGGCRACHDAPRTGASRPNHANQIDGGDDRRTLTWVRQPPCVEAPPRQRAGRTAHISTNDKQ
jgi:hypothetical protein